MKKVLALHSGKNDGVIWYRFKQFAKKCKELELLDVQCLPLYENEEKIAEIIKAADAYFALYGWAVEMPFLIDLIRQRKNKPLIVDVDDKFDEVTPYSDAYKTYGLKEVQLKDGTWLWRNGKDGFDVGQNKKRVGLVFELLREADLIITPTQKIKDWLQTINPKIAIVPNCIDELYFPCPVKINDGAVRVGWAGGSSHYEDVMSIMPALKRVMEQYPHVVYYHIGQWFGAIEKYIPPSRIKKYDWISADGHGYRMACANIDIGLCPLTGKNFDQCKSALKFYEYSAIRAATLAYNSPPYSDEIVDGKNGLLYRTEDEFEQKLGELIKNVVRRRVIANEAYDYVCGLRNVNIIVDDWVECILGVIEAKNKS